MEVKQLFHVKNNPAMQCDKRAIGEAVLDYYKLGAASDVFVLADLGCSSGPNALSFVSEVIASVTERCRQLGRCPPTFLAFLNDLPGSDFNAMLRSLPRQWSAVAPGGGREDGPRCFVAGVPGSFYGRLFPTNSVHLFHSAYAAHFLSQVPPELESGEIVNKGGVYASRSSGEGVWEAYYRQFQRDFSTFLRARAEEMVIGGRLLLFLTAREEESTSSMEPYTLNLMAEILIDMASEDLIEEGKIDSFNFPIYFASAREVELEIQREGSFSIKSLEAFPSELPGIQPQVPGDTSPKDDTKGAVFARSLGAILEPFLSAHIGRETMEILFRRFAKALDLYFLTNKAELPTMMVALEKIYV